MKNYEFSTCPRKRKLPDMTLMKSSKGNWKNKQRILGILSLGVCAGCLLMGIGSPLIIMLPLALALLFSKEKIIY